MEPLYPQNIVERMFPIFRERREKEEREALFRSEDRGPSIGLEAFRSENLYGSRPYEGGSVGKHLNTLA